LWPSQSIIIVENANHTAMERQQETS
jgi:hypothetical protein